MDGVESALHPRLDRDDALRGLARRWEGGALVLPEALAPGLVAGLVPVLQRLALAPRLYPAHGDQSWSLDVQLADQPDPQYPPSLLRARRLMQRDLAELIRRLGVAVLPCPDPLHAWAWRKGAYVERGAPLAPAGGVDALVALTGTPWPTGWGGHLLVDGSPLAVAPGTVVFLRDARFEVPLLTRHVEALWLRAWYPPEAP